MNEHCYTVNLKWTSNVEGKVSSPGRDHELEIAMPHHLPGGVEGKWTPEHLLAASVNTCFMITFLLIAKKYGLEISAYTSSSVGKTEKVNGKFLMSEVELEPEITLINESDREKAEQILSKSESACLISNSLKSTVRVKARIGTKA